MRTGLEARACAAGRSVRGAVRQRVSDAERAAFAESLKQLIATGRIWVVATLRADLYELLLKQPTLKALKETGASLDLGPPGPAELAEIVRAPARRRG